MNKFTTSEKYWIERYDEGYTSGDGSYNKLAEFKAEVINNTIKENNIQSIIEYGCGDGNQLKLLKCTLYTGFDVSPKALELCRYIFKDDKTKQFKLMKDYNNEKAQLTLSLDVIFHLVEDNVYENYMKRLFNSSLDFVIIYSSDYESTSRNHDRRRQFTKWISNNIKDFKLMQFIPNKYPYNGDGKNTSLSDFFIYRRCL